MITKFADAVRQIDIYGYPYMWSFNGREESFKTFIGGTFTIASYVIIML